MGYQTDFEGRINLSRELTDSEARVIRDFAEERHGGNIGGYTTRVQGYWCNWEPTKDLTGIEWNGAEKFYDADEWMALIVEDFIAPWGIVANGVINAQGEEGGDVWRIVVRDNVVTRENAMISWPS